MARDRFINTSYNYRFEDTDGMTSLLYVMRMFRCGFRTLGGLEVMEVLDCRKHRIGYTKSEAVEYRLAGGSVVTIRPSVNKPELTADISVAGGDPETAAAIEARIREDLEGIIYMDSRMGYCCE